MDAQPHTLKNSGTSLRPPYLTLKPAYQHLKGRKILDIYLDPSVRAGSWREGPEPETFEGVEEGLFSDGVRHFVTSKGGWIIMPDGDAHLFYLPEGRGRFAYNHSLYVLSLLDDKIHGEIALKNRAACRFVESLGCQLITRKTGNYWIGNEKTDLGLYEYG